MHDIVLDIYTISCYAPIIQSEQHQHTHDNLKEERQNE